MRVEIRQFKSLFTFWLLNKSPDRDFDLKMLAGKLWFLIPYCERKCVNLRVSDSTESTFHSNADGIVQVRQVIGFIAYHLSFVVEALDLTRSLHVIL
jgi:hypothetical protein